MLPPIFSFPPFFGGSGRLPLPRAKEVILSEAKLQIVLIVGARSLRHRDSDLGDIVNGFLFSHKRTMALGFIVSRSRDEANAKR
jgi:hypothetical protein